MPSSRASDNLSTRCVVNEIEGNEIVIVLKAPLTEVFNLQRLENLRMRETMLLHPFLLLWVLNVPHSSEQVTWIDWLRNQIFGHIELFFIYEIRPFTNRTRCQKIHNTSQEHDRAHFSNQY